MNGQWIECRLSNREGECHCCSVSLTTPFETHPLADVPIFFPTSVIESIKVGDRFAWRIQEDTEYNEDNIEIKFIDYIVTGISNVINDISKIKNDMLNGFKSVLDKFDAKEITLEECVVQYNEVSLKYFTEIEVVLGKNTFRKIFNSTAEEAGNLIDEEMFRRAHQI